MVQLVVIFSGWGPTSGPTNRSRRRFSFFPLRREFLFATLIQITFPGPTFWPKLFWQVLGQVWAWEGRGCGDTCNMANLLWPRLEGLRCFWNHHFLIPGVDSNHTTPMWNLASKDRMYLCIVPDFNQEIRTHRVRKGLFWWGRSQHKKA